MTEQQLQDLAERERNLHVEIVATEPVCVACVPMDSLGQIGTLFIFRDDAGILKALPVPLIVHEMARKPNR